MRSCYDCYIRPKSSKIVCLCEIKEVVMVDMQVQVSCLQLLLSQLACLE